MRTLAHPSTRIALLLMPLIATMLMTLTQPAHAQATPAAKLQQFVYVLRLAPKFQTEAAWTDVEKTAVGQHFERLSKATQAGQVVMAGRTSEALDKTFGLVVFEAENEAAARAFMEGDPAIVAGLMTATLHPYSIALLRK